VRVIDARGRLLGRVNFFDAIAVLLLVAMAGFAAVGYSLFRLPHNPIIETVEPSSITDMAPQRVRLKGQNFLPYMRAFIDRSDGKDFVLRPDEAKSSDAFTLVNNSQIKLLLESPTFAELEVPPLPAGTYDLRLYNDTKLVLERRMAFTVAPAGAKPGPQWEPTGVVIAHGAFTNLRPGAEVEAIHAGVQVTGGGVAWGDVLAVDPPKPDVASILVGNARVPVDVIGRVQVPATLRVRCIIDDTDCRVLGAQVAPTHVLVGAIGSQAATFRVTGVEADAGRKAPIIDAER
jgi:hypothetical protein